MLEVCPLCWSLRYQEVVVLSETLDTENHGSLHFRLGFAGQDVDLSLWTLFPSGAGE
jgi:hypothetical protein